MGARNDRPVLELKDVVGKGYGKFWDFRGRYLVCKGSRASKKSKTTALRIIHYMMKYDQSNTLVIRKTAKSLKDSCYTDLQWAANRLGYGHLWNFKLSPLEAVYTKTGQKILFRGLDDPLKVTSITVPYGYLCWGWIEEAYELNSESAFDTLNESIRGALPPHLWKQWIITFNPWNDRHWLKKRFFDREDPDILAITTNYTCNEWLDKADAKVFEDMKLYNPRRYQVAGLGNWGIVEGLVYEKFHLDADFKIKDLEGYDRISGLDFGYSNDPTAFFVGFVSREERKIYIWDELYKTGLTNDKIYQEIYNMGYAREKIIADSSEPKSIAELKKLGLNIKGALKGKDSISYGTQYIQNFDIYIHPRCVNFATEIQNYQWEKDKFGKAIDRPVDDFNHLMDALRYAMERYSRPQAGYKSVEGTL